MLVFGFQPYFDKYSEVLVLGSFPSVKSRKVNFYYGNPQNRFWKTLATTFNEPVPLSESEKKSLLSRNKIALWDVITACEIIGSSDSSIKNATVADVNALIDKTNISKIILNGKTAEKYFLKSFPNLSNMATCLPSTSSANPRFDMSLWQNALLNK